MIFRQEFLDGIQKGIVTVAFRRWRRPSVKSGGTLLTAVGMLHIRDVSLTSLETISNADARRAGYESREALAEALTERSDGKIYRMDHDGKLLGWAQTSLGQGQTGCLIHSLHAEGDNVLYKGSCSLWNVEKITIKE